MLLDEQVRALEVEGKVHTYVGWECRFHHNP